MKLAKLQCEVQFCKSSQDIVESTCSCKTVLCVACFLLRVIKNGINCPKCNLDLGKARVNGKLIVAPIISPDGHVYCAVGAGVGDSSLHFEIPADDRDQPPTYLLKDQTIHRLEIERSAEPRTYTVKTAAGNMAMIKFAEDYRSATYQTNGSTWNYRLNTCNQLINDYCNIMRRRQRCPMKNCSSGQGRHLKFIDPECGHFACTDCMKSKFFYHHFT